MTATTIELMWTPVEGATGYRIYRVDGLEGFEPNAVSLGRTDLVYDGLEVAFTDQAIEVDQFYTYILEVEAGESTLERRWVQTLAVDDVEPPTDIESLTAARTPEGVLLTWDSSQDDVEFSSYSVYLIVDDQRQYLGGGGDVEQTSFIDRQPPLGSATYVVEAVDFHGNRSPTAAVVIEGEGSS